MLSFEKCKCRRTPLEISESKRLKCPLFKSPGDRTFNFYKSVTKNLIPLETIRSAQLSINTSFQRTPAIRPALKHISIDKDVLFPTINLSKMLSMCSWRAWNVVWVLRGMRELANWHNNHQELLSSSDMKPWEIQMNSLVPPEARFLALGSKGVGKSGTNLALSTKSM